jgi:hypothetical protein
MQRVVGVALGGEAVGLSLDALADAEAGAAATTISVGGEELIVLWKAGQATALEQATVDAGRDVGSVGVFRPVAGETTVTIRAADGAFTDEETGSTWTIAGRAEGGPLAGTTLERVPHLDTFWFAWSTYRPGTELIEEV